MKRVIIVPAAEVARFTGMTVLASAGSIAALIGDTFASRRRSAFASEDIFFEAVARGLADLYTFDDLAGAAEFATAKINALMQAAEKLATSDIYVQKMTTFKVVNEQLKKGA